MAHIINEKCTACGKCLPECPVQCIEESDIYKIDPEVCIDCGICISVCQHDAIVGKMYYRKQVTEK